MIGFPGRVGILFSDPARVVIRPRAYIITRYYPYLVSRATLLKAQAKIAVIILYITGSTDIRREIFLNRWKGGYSYYKFLELI